MLEYSAPLWPFLVYAVAVIATVLGIMVLSYLLGERHQAAARGQPYESGIAVTGTGRSRVDVKFYRVAMFFLLFDLETAFIVAWAVAARELGWTGYVAIMVFIGLLLVALAYIWRLGALDWGRVLPPTPRLEEGDIGRERLKSSLRR